MKPYWIAFAFVVAALVGVPAAWLLDQRLEVEGDKDPVVINQCLRTQLFKLCIETNKPDENVDRESLIDACGRQARDQALLRKSAVQPEQCWVPE